MSRQIRRALALSAVAAPIALAVPLLATSAQATSNATHCVYAQLKVTEGSGDAGAGHIEFPIHFRNVSSTTCTLYGYPGAAGLNKNGKQVVQAERTPSGVTGGLKEGHSVPLVTLAPGQEATARIEGSDVPSGNAHSCRVLHGLIVTPPNDRKSVHLKHSPPACGLQIHPVIKGSSGTQL